MQCLDQKRFYEEALLRPLRVGVEGEREARFVVFGADLAVVARVRLGLVVSAASSTGAEAASTSSTKDSSDVALAFDLVERGCLVLEVAVLGWV